MDYKFVFERPTMDGFPKVFKECECKSKTDPNKSVRIKIQEVPEDMHDRLIEFMVKYYLPDEPLARTSGVIAEEDSLETYKFIFYLVLKQNLSLVALTEGTDGQTEIVGAQLYTVFSLDDPPLPDMPGKAIATLRKFLYDIKTEEIIGGLNLYQHLQDWGLCVDPQYRGWGVGEEILRTGNDLGAHIGVQTIITVFTVINSQVMAHRMGYSVLNQFKYKEYKDEDGNLAFPGVENTEFIKLMILSF
uniref:N-acetyltransferase domain-containing protein n=2 Tax=Cacopsylla melanoneura TaxID=428564 RepID=A0A8D8V4C7_9HEMI